jgi:hypothetical protein
MNDPILAGARSAMRTKYAGKRHKQTKNSRVDGSSEDRQWNIHGPWVKFHPVLE